MKKTLIGALWIYVCGVSLLVAQNRKDAGKISSATTKAKSKSSTGDDVFQANCQRCHVPPMSISPRTTGTIIMHMRTRARLSREDEDKLLHFMAP